MDVKCKKCQGHYLLRQGKYGLFAGCSNFPRCRSTMKLAEFLKASGQTEASFFPKPSQELPTRYVAFDVESPNKANDRMSAIGVAVVEDGGIVEEFYTTVDPEVHFDPFNIQLTGLSEAVVAGSPTFPELWPTLEPLLSSGLLIAHNAPFDMSVLAKCLRDYNLPWRGISAYACTFQMGCHCYPELPGHKLSTLCDHCHISLDHHHAGSDSRGCALLLLDYLDHGIDLKDFLRQYDMVNMRTIRAHKPKAAASTEPS